MEECWEPKCPISFPSYSCEHNTCLYRWEGTFRAEGAWVFEVSSQNTFDAANFAVLRTLLWFLKEESSYTRCIKLKIQLLCSLKKPNSPRILKAQRCFVKSREVLNIKKDNIVKKNPKTPPFLLSLVHNLPNCPICLITLKGLDWLKDQTLPGASTSGLVFWTPTGICQDRIFPCWLFSNYTETFLSSYYWSTVCTHSSKLSTHKQSKRGSCVSPHWWI